MTRPASLPLTVADWRAAYRGGAEPRELLVALRRFVEAASPAEAWIARIDAPALAAELDRLAAQAAAHPDRAALLAALPLWGVPFAAKDNIDVAGFPTTAACPAFAYRPAADAHVVARARAAGAVCFGKTNLDQFATGLVGARSPYGRPSSAHSAQHVSGGSSSGSAVVVARGDMAFAFGTDTAGSGRIPAGFNHVVGMKPTPGRVGTRGVVPACRSLDCVSVFALTVDDAAAVLAVVEGPDPEDAASRFRPGPAALPAPLRIGIPAPLGLDLAARDVAALFESARGHAARLGHTIRRIDAAPLDAVAALLYDGPWVAERHAVVQPLLDHDPAALDPAVRQVIEGATRFSATDAFRARYALDGLALGLRPLWHEIDLIMVPTAPGHPTHVEVDADPIGANAALGRFTNFVNLLGWCALALPFGFTPDGLPFGVTFIAPGDADAALLRFGRAWAASLGAPLGATGRLPADSPDTATGRWPASRPVLPIAVVGAHLAGQPLNGQLTGCGAVLRETTRTAARYRLHALAGARPPKPGLERLADGDTGGATIEVEVWDVPLDAVGGLLAQIPAPLGLGTLELEDGRRVHGFVCEPCGLVGAEDITRFGGWRAYLAAGR